MAAGARLASVGSVRAAAFWVHGRPAAEWIRRLPAGVAFRSFRRTHSSQLHFGRS